MPNDAGKHRAWVQIGTQGGGQSWEDNQVFAIVTVGTIFVQFLWRLDMADAGCLVIMFEATHREGDAKSLEYEL